MRVSISAIGSVITINHYLLPEFTVYQLAFLTPGICPLWANSRKQIRHSLNLRITECGRPQRSQRVYSRTLNFCGRRCLAIIDFLATNFPPSYYRAYFWKDRKSTRLNSSHVAISY